MVSSSKSTGNNLLNNLVDKLVNEKIIKTKRISEVMKKVDRAEFMTGKNKLYAYVDAP